MRDIVLVFQIVISFVLIVLILMQSKGTGLSSAFGGSGQVYRSKRGVEKFVVYLTVIFVVLFFAVSILQIFVTK